MSLKITVSSCRYLYWTDFIYLNVLFLVVGILKRMGLKKVLSWNIKEFNRNIYTGKSGLSTLQPTSLVLQERARLELHLFFPSLHQMPQRHHDLGKIGYWTNLPSIWKPQVVRDQWEKNFRSKYIAFFSGFITWLFFFFFNFSQWSMYLNNNFIHFYWDRKSVLTGDLKKSVCGGVVCLLNLRSF